MPRKPKQPCAYPNCNKLCEGRYCEEHKRLTDKRYNSLSRPKDTNKKYGRAWRKVRERYVQSHPLCEQCLKEGRMTPTEEVHHIKPVSQGGTHSSSNLMSLCKSCHNNLLLLCSVIRLCRTAGPLRVVQRMRSCYFFNDQMTHKA